MAFPGDGPVASLRRGREIGSSCPASAQCGRESAPPAACWRLPLSETLFAPPGSFEPSAFHRVFSKTTPPSACLLESTPTGLRPLRPGCFPAPCTFRPRRSSRPRRFPPPTGSRACCVPHPTLRFIGLPRPGVACLRIASALSLRCLPSRAFPFREAVHTSPCSHAPLSFTGNAAATTRPCSARKSVTKAVRGRTASLDALLGFPTWSPTRTRHPRRSLRERRMCEGRQGPAQGGPIRWPSPRPQRHRCPKASATPRLRGGGRPGRHHCRASASVET